MMELLRILGLLINHLFDTLTAIDGSLQPKFTNIYDPEAGRQPFHRFQFQVHSASKAR